jgi:predicted Zn finger-like uncharacterized protein
MTVRLRRLQADYEKLREFVRRQPRVRLVHAEGDPPERYKLEYQIRCLRQVDDQLQYVDSNLVEIMLPRSYPRMPPQCRMLTPVFHPNIAPHAICIGDHWSAGEPLWSMVARIGEMLAYQSYNTKSPLNGEAARWVEQNVERLPLDRINLAIDDPIVAAPPPAPPVARVPPVVQPAAPPAAAPPASQPGAPPLVGARVPATTVTVECPSCKAGYRVPEQAAGKRIRCKHCQAVIDIPRGPAEP